MRSDGAIQRRKLKRAIIIILSAFVTYDADGRTPSGQTRDDEKGT